MDFGTLITGHLYVPAHCYHFDDTWNGMDQSILATWLLFCTLPNSITMLVRVLTIATSMGRDIVNNPMFPCKRVHDASGRIAASLSKAMRPMANSFTKELSPGSTAPATPSRTYRPTSSRKALVLPARNDNPVPARSSSRSTGA